MDDDMKKLLFKIKNLFFIPILLITQTMFGTFLYVDNAATGANNGTSWANAWTNLNAIVWSSVSAGDTIYVSGGSYSSLITVKGGTAGNPITIKKSQEVGHNGIITNATIEIKHPHITVDGSLNDAYGTTVISNNTYNVRYITNNTGWKVINTLGEVFISGTATNGITLKWLWLEQQGLAASTYNLRLNAAGTPLYYTNMVFEYLYMYYATDAGAKIERNNADYFDSVIFRYCWVERPSSDGIAHNAGTTIHHCIISNCRYESGHPDGISCGIWNKSKYHHNIVYDFSNQQIYPLTLIITNSGLHIYNNLFYREDMPWQTCAFAASPGMEDGFYTYNPTNTPTVYFSDIRIFNNTIIADRIYIWNPWTFYNRYSTTMSITLAGYYAYNNVFYNGDQIAHGEGPNYIFGTNTYKFDYNNTWSSTVNGKRISYLYSSYANASAFNAAAPQGQSNVNGDQPNFVNISSWDYRPSIQDTALRNKGTNLTSWVADMPDLNKDLYGNTRGSDGTWDIGAIKSDTSLLVWLKFTNDFSLNGGTLTDSSGNGYDFIRTGVTGTSYPSNFLTSILATAYTGVYTGAAALSWEYYIQPPDNRANFENGTWGALTNINAFTNLPLMSFSFWAASDTNRQNYSATVLDAGVNGFGCWTVGRFFSYSPTNNMKWTISTNYAGAGVWDRCLDLRYPSDTENVWNHYAGTFSNGVCIIYFNGTNCGSTTLLGGITNLSLWLTAGREDTQQSYMPWISVGCRNHNGNPYIADWDNANDYPNNGWWSGGIGSVRIYNTVLSSSEIQTIYSSESSESPSPPGNLNIIQQLRVGSAVFR